MTLRIASESAGQRIAGHRLRRRKNISLPPSCSFVFDHVARFIVNANHSVVMTAETKMESADADAADKGSFDQLIIADLYQ
jgi:hypothetical protein